MGAEGTGGKGSKWYQAAQHQWKLAGIVLRAQLSTATWWELPTKEKEKLLLNIYIFVIFSESEYNNSNLFNADNYAPMHSF
jgi:hypothetical protein